MPDWFGYTWRLLPKELCYHLNDDIATGSTSKGKVSKESACVLCSTGNRREILLGLRPFRPRPLVIPSCLCYNRPTHLSDGGRVKRKHRDRGFNWIVNGVESKCFWNWRWCSDKLPLQTSCRHSISQRFEVLVVCCKLWKSLEVVPEDACLLSSKENGRFELYLTC